jgi:hypothetical protein
VEQHHGDALALLELGQGPRSFQAACMLSQMPSGFSSHLPPLPAPTPFPSCRPHQVGNFASCASLPNQQTKSWARRRRRPPRPRQRRMAPRTPSQWQTPSSAEALSQSTMRAGLSLRSPATSSRVLTGLGPQLGKSLPSGSADTAARPFVVITLPSGLRSTSVGMPSTSKCEESASYRFSSNGSASHGMVAKCIP